MKIALISHLFPTELHPHLGKFIQDQLLLLESAPNTDTKLVIPTPYSIPFSSRSKKSRATLAGNTKGERLHYLSFPKKRFPKIIASSLSRSIEKYFESKPFDLAHVHWLYPDALCIPKLKEMGMKCVLTIHGSDWYQTKDNPQLMDLFTEVFDKVDQVLYSGPKLKESIEGFFPELAKKSELIYNFVDESKYRMASGIEKKEARKALGWEANKTHALTVANIQHEKGIDILLNAVGTSENLKDIQFHIIGAQGQHEYGRKTKQAIDSTPFQNIVMHKPVSPSDLVAYYQAADFFVQPSRREGFSVAILEAKSCGLPIVCTDVGGNHLLMDETTGRMVNAPFEQNLRAEILGLFNTLEKYNGAQIRDQVITEYGRNAFQKRLLRIYNSVV